MKIYFSPFFIQEPINLATVKEKGQEYILFRMVAGEYLTLENPNTLLLVPNDNSVFAQQIKEAVEKDETYHCVFATSAENLKVKPNFWKTKNLTFHGLLIKDAGQVEKIVGKNSKPDLEPNQITFKVTKWTKGEENEWGSYIGILEVEPFSLGIEGMPPITRLEFKFSTKENPQPGPSEPGIKKLTESDLYNNKLLTDGSGKTLSLGVKKFYFNGPNTLYFENSDSYVFSSLSEKKDQNNPESPTKTPSKNDNSENPQPEPNSIKPEKSKEFGTLKVVLITSGIIVGLSFFIFIIIRYAKKKKK